MTTDPLSFTEKAPSKKQPAKIWLALRFYALPLNIFALSDQSAGAIVLEKNSIVYANARAIEAGIKKGMNSTTAQALCECLLLERNTDKEQEALMQLSELLYEFTPYIDSYKSHHLPESGLLLELSRCLRLFNGLPSLCNKIFSRLQQSPYSFAFGLGHTAAAAWLLSWQTHDITGKENRTLFIERLKKCTLDYLHDFPKEVSALEKAGFATLGDIVKQMNSQTLSHFRKRYGNPFADYLQQLYGMEQNVHQTQLFDIPVKTFQPIEHFFDSLQFDYPITLTEQLYLPMENMLQKLAEYLVTRQQQCQQITWKFYDIRHNSETLQVYCDNQQSHWSLLLELSRIQLENKALPFEVDTLELLCRHTSPRQSHSNPFNFEQKKIIDSNSFAITAAKLKARLGNDALCKISYHDSHIPEQSNLFIAAETTSQQTLPLKHHPALRPTWLFDTPLAIQLRQNNLYWRGYLQKRSLPERIEGHWWDTPTARDYYIAQRDDHLHLWIFLDLYKNSWWVQGVFG